MSTAKGDKVALLPADKRKKQAAEQRGFFGRVGQSLKRGATYFAVGAVTLGYGCYLVCPPVPSCVTRKIAFHPPTAERYHFVVRNHKGEEVPATAKQCEGKEIIRVVIDCHPESQEKNVIVQGVRPFVVRTRKGHVLAALHLPCRLLNRPKALEKKVVIFSQPNSTNMAFFLISRNFAAFWEMSDKFGVDLYVYDYSGFGISSGSASEANVYADLTALYKHVRTTRPDCEVSGRPPLVHHPSFFPICLVGMSLGTAVSIDIAARHPPALCGVVLMAPFTSGMRALCGSEDNRFPFDAFRSLEKISKIEVPVLITHGLRDELIPFGHSLQLVRACQKPVPPIWARRADHSTILLSPISPVFGQVVDFLLNDCEKYDERYTKEEVVTDAEYRLRRLLEFCARQQQGVRVRWAEREDAVQKPAIVVEKAPQQPAVPPKPKFDSIRSPGALFEDFDPEDTQLSSPPSDSELSSDSEIKVAVKTGKEKSP
ncbi:Hydrolase [Aphelenchoides fujianensis]|nr:Hydrolase [Aphelenchoides fujianensis]